MKVVIALAAAMLGGCAAQTQASPAGAPKPTGAGYALISCQKPTNYPCQKEAEFQQPEASAKCQRALRTYAARNPGRAPTCNRMAAPG